MPRWTRGQAGLAALLLIAGSTAVYASGGARGIVGPDVSAPPEGTDAECGVSMSVPRGTRSLEVVGVPPDGQRRFVLVHAHALASDEAEARVVVYASADIVVATAGEDGEAPATSSIQTLVQGRVFDAFGRPAVAAMCVACSGSDYLASALTGDDGVYSMSVPLAHGSRVQLSARFPAWASTSRGVVSDVVAGSAEPTVFLEEVGPLEARAGRRAPRAGYRAATGSQ